MEYSSASSNGHGSGSGTYNNLLLSYTNWVTQQHQDLDELRRVLTSDPNNRVHLRTVIDRVLFHLEEYIDRRAQLALMDPTWLFYPSWCSNLERSILWFGGYRPSMNIRMVYAICGMEMEASLEQYLQGVRTGGLGEISGHQLNLINALQAKTVMEEDRIAAQMAGASDAFGDGLLLRIIRYTNGALGGWSLEVKRAIEENGVELGNVFIEADKLRFDTIKGLLQILTPFQAIDLLITINKLHLSLGLWGQIMDQMLIRRGSTRSSPNANP